MAPFPNLNGVLLINTDNICSKSVMSLYLSSLIPHSMYFLLLYTDNVCVSMFVIIMGRMLVLLLTHDKDLVLHSVFHLLVIL